jgi:predicted metal-dependent peptidase
MIKWKIASFLTKSSTNQGDKQEIDKVENRNVTLGVTGHLVTLMREENTSPNKNPRSDWQMLPCCEVQVGEGWDSD